MDLYGIMYEKLHKSEPFIYEIRGTMYYIGASVFRECNEQEQHLYKQFREEFRIVQTLAGDLCKKDVERLCELFDAIKGEKIFEYQCENEDEACRELDRLLRQLSQEELSDLQIQQNNILEVYDYRVGAFYRRANYKKM